jgi:Domain of unknown function (DUF5625)
MAPIIFSLCYKPVIGIVMIVLFLCGAPRLFSDEPIDLTIGGSSFTRSVTAPIDMTYALVLTFEFPSVEARLHDQIAGSTYANLCMGLVSHDTPEFERIRYEDIPDMQRRVLGLPIPFKVVVQKATDGSVMVDHTFQSLCITSIDGRKKKQRDIAWLQLPIGDYTVKVTNLQAQSDLPNVHTTISLHGKQAK